MENVTGWSVADSPLAQPWNSSIAELADLTMDRNFALLLTSLVSALLWLVYITYYNSRLLGYIITRLINKFYFQDENFKIGSFTVNALSGKIMFRDIVYINYDYTLRIQDGYLIFRWWRSYVPKDVSEDLSHSDTRLSIMLNGFELHVYNRCDMYNELEKIFGLEPLMRHQEEDECDGDRDKAMNDANEKRRRAADTVRSEAAMARTWRDLIPVIKTDVCSGRVVFGNRLVPTTLSISAEEAHLVYSTKPPASSLDHLMHFVKAKADNCKVILAPSPNYTAMVDEPPRYMGEGFVVMSSNYIELYFYMDEPGLVPERPVLLQLANGDVVESAPPIWGVDIKCGKGTDFSYGPWADRQRDHLFKFFFPPNYKTMEVTPQPKPGDRRQMQSFDIRLSTLNEATIDILFTKNKETNAVHINIGAGSYLEVTLPWIVLQDGYTTKITGQLLHLEATTSLQYRSLVESETLEYTVKCHFPLAWNHHQCWQLALTGCKATAHLVYTHIDFFQDLVNDWASKARPDILHFVPYTWKISLLLKECEVVTVSNQYNWIDCSSTNQENNHVAFCGDLLDVSFDLPFVDFLPDVIPLKIWVQGEAVDMSLYLPEVNTSRLLLLSIDKNMKLVPCRLKASKWRRKCVKSQGWVDCWSVPIVALSVRYNYHPIPPLGPEPQADITTPEKEELLLSPMRIPRMRKQPQINWTMDGNKLDRTTLAPDKVNVELEVGPSVLLAYGTIITSFMNLLENIFGEDQTFTDMQKAPNMESFYWPEESNSKANDKSSISQHNEIIMDDSTESSKGAFDPRRCRPLDVTVSIIIHDIQAHLVKNCSENEPPCPVVLIERFGFEMDKSFKETKLQLLLSPSILISSNNLARTNTITSGALHQGHLMLSSFQLRGHGFFSDANRSVEEETIEYAWMMELQLGQLTGRLTLPQLYHVVSSLETFLLLICDSENELFPPNPSKECHHGMNSVACPESDATLKYRCPTPNEIKYRMFRVAIDLIDIYVADSNTTLQTWISPIRLSFCNLHGSGCGSGVTALLPNVKLALYTMTNLQSSAHHLSNGSSSSQSKLPETDNWVNVGILALGPLLVEAASSLPQSPKNLHLVQQKFLKVHDDKTKRLWFMWPAEGRSAQCGCIGGCAFFGSNRNGPNFLKPSAADLAEGVNVAMFNVIETTAGEFGYGQSVLHAGQLVFHTPPYSGLNVCLQPLHPAPSPLPPPGRSPQAPERRSLTRRFSYTSIGKGSSNVLVSSTKSDVPYARLVDSTVAIGNSKIDSDSKLNKTILNVPQLESSVSDSKLALSCMAKDNSNVVSKKFVPSDNDAFTIPKAPGSRASESHYSLNSQVPHEEVPPEVQRTLSITSENQSETFFSADEDIFPSRSSSLKHSFGSRHSNHKEKTLFGVSEGINEKWTNSMPRSEPGDKLDTASNMSLGGQPDSESGSVSSTSFISAISSQEDMTLVNLHMQTNKPIVESPLLMSSYIQNLPQYRCGNWSTCSLPGGNDVITMPLFKRADDGSLVYVGQKYLPKFEPIGKVNILKLISKKDGQNSQNQHGFYGNAAQHFNSQIKAHPFPSGWWDIQQTVQDNQENATDKSSASTATTTGDSRAGVLVKLRGEVDITLTPLVLETTQKFVESLTPVLANIHPVTVLNHLRLLCISSVQSANVLKQKQHVMSWLPQMEARGQPPAADRCRLATIPETNVYEETICEQLQATLTVPKVNIVFIQSSVVEDMISFSALDNIQDLTCVSLFGVCVENIVAKYVSSKRSLESVQLYYRPTLRTLANKKSFGIMKGPRALISQGSGRKRGPEKGDPVYIETSQQQNNDIAVTLNIGKVHGQLRRIRNDASQLKDVTITGIPNHLSKVSFKFAKIEPCGKTCDATCCQNGNESRGDSSIGHIMFECGLEGVGIKVSKHEQSLRPGEEARAESDSCRESVRSEERARAPRLSGLDELFRRREPGTPAPPGEATPDDQAPALAPRDDSNTSACSIDLKLIWFNFAAPPRTPITRKIDYTRLDWNLLSTASPAINAWLNPCNRLAIRVVALYRAHARRLTATAASLMAAALDAPPHHAAPKSRYGRHTALARQLRAEPALQLVAVLVRHALQADAAALQADLADRHLPSLSTLRQGVIVLSRQWKNILYTPLLLEHNYKSKALKPLNVTFALPDLLEDFQEGGEARTAETLDESCLLLDVDLDALTHAHAADAEQGAVGGMARGSLALPALPFVRRARLDDAYDPLSEEALGSSPSLNEQPSRHQDLYQWMARQEPVAPPQSKKPVSVGARVAAPQPCSVLPVQGSLMLLDAHLVFQPLLRALGVSPHQLQGARAPAGGVAAAAALAALGPQLSLLGWVDVFRIDIVVSDTPHARTHLQPQKGGCEGESGAETAAFLCERVSLEVELRKVADVAVDELVRRRNVLYISRNQLKKHITTLINFNLGVRFISQQVNMPLLRLLHQISNMYQNVKDAQQELRAQTDSTRRPRTRQDHTSSDVSDFRENLVSVSSLEKEVPKWEPPPRPPPPTLPPPTPTPAPPPAQRPRPQSFAQKLRSTGKSVKGKLGYSSLSEGAHTPQFLAGAGAAAAADPGTPAAPPPAPAAQLAPHCWRTVYQLLDLYANMPEPDTITHRFSVSEELPPCVGTRARAGTGLAVTGVARLHRTRLLASLSGLKLEAELTALTAALTAAARAEITGTLARTTIVLLEGPAPDHQTVVRIGVGKSQALYGWESGGASLLASVGGVRVDLPQHPVALHGVMTRSSRHLSSTLQELGVTRTVSRVSRAGESSPEGSPPPPPPRPPPPPPRPPPDLASPFTLHFSISVQSVSVTAALLPSLQAAYKMENVVSSGVAGPRAALTAELPSHSLSFVTRLGAGEGRPVGGAEGRLPAAAAVALPAVHVAARVRDAPAPAPGEGGALLVAGRYLAATADIGLFEHTLSTDLLNHLVFVQKVFMKEVNEVVQKVYGGEKPVPLWTEEESSASALSRLLFSLVIRIKRIQLTATTPSNSAVRLETGAVEFELSNRVQNVPAPAQPHDLRLFARAQVDVNLSLGQLIRNAMFEEAEPEFQQYAFFKTRILMRNAFQEETSSAEESAAEARGAVAGADVVLITLRRPLVYVQPVAVDRAILVWLNYKNAYEYWAAQRRSLNKEVLAATAQLMEKVQLSHTAPASTLFLQLNVDDIGVCLPLHPAPMGLSACGGTSETEEGRGAVVVTLESTSVSACSSGALVSAGRFVGLCLRFATDFEASLDDWQPRADEPAPNVCRVSEGTYQVCSRTTAATQHENAKWFLNVSWQMEGVDIHLDTSVGKQLSALGHTLTMLTGFEEEEEEPSRMEDESDFDDEPVSKDSQESLVVRRRTTGSTSGVFSADARLDARTRCRLIEHEMSEQARIISDLRALGASHQTVELEIRRLHDLEALVFRDFRRDMLQKLRRQSVKASSITKGKLGLGSSRSRSVAGPAPRVKSAPAETEALLLEAEDERLADIMEGASWSSVESEPARGPPVQRQASLPAQPDPAWREDDPPVELRRKHEHYNGSGGGGGAGSGAGEGEARKGKAAAPEPRVDFELGVKVHINSGKCALHTKDHHDDNRLGPRSRVGRSASGGLEGGSPGARRKGAAPAPPPPPRHATHDLTVFRVPGLQLKVHYESKTMPEDSASPGGAGAGAGAGAGVRRMPSKKAALLAWITVQSIPEETVISPHILEFLEQALEPLPPRRLPAPPPEAEAGAGAGAGEGYGQYVYASFPVDVIVHFHMQPSTYRFSCLPASRVECLLQLPSLQMVFSSKRQADTLDEEWGGAEAGGLSVTGCLADFSVYVFHPYGGKPAKEAPPDRKDSLSVNVEFVKFHLARSRKLHLDADTDRSKAVVRFSTIVDVGSAWFKYDMRRLSEILAFPKAWYRRTIVRRMFLGDLSVRADHDPHDHHTGAGAAPVSPMLPQREKAKTDYYKSKERRSSSSSCSGAAWETLVLFAVNFTRLNVHMNMGNVMGVAGWQSRGCGCGGRLSIRSTGHRNMLLSVALKGSGLDARGGIVGGAISVADIHTYVHISEERGRSPVHVVGGAALGLEARLEYMGTLVLLARGSRLLARARDDWRPPHVLAHAALRWHQLQLLLSRSTTPDLLKMHLKLDEFFTMQFNSSRRVLSALHPEYRARRAAQRAAPPAAAEAGERAEAGAHWRHVARLLAALTQPAANGTVVGGTMELRGSNISLGCFHGNSFKAKSWALFSLKDPCISFATEARDLGREESAEGGVSVSQSLTASLGTGTDPGTGTGTGTAPGAGACGHQSMATVCRMTRAVLFPPQFKTIREWFIYAFANSEIDAIDLFPSLERTGDAGERNTGSTERPGKGGAGAGAGAAGAGAGAGGGSHVREVIFALPALQLHLRTHHTRTAEPVVECSFITEFEDHIFVSVDAEAFLFLHDLISSYIKEKDRLAAGPAPRGAPPAPPAPPADARHYRCTTWHLEPTVRLLSWAGKSIEPYGVDYILQKLGFSHARTTIPKWLQRGTLDPLDAALALLLKRLLALMPRHSHAQPPS